MENSSSLGTVSLPVEYLKRFSYDDLKSLTNDFDTKIGFGGFGKVYKGKFPNGMQIAVKVLNELYVTEDLFMNEVRIMGVIYHHRLVRFLGYCSDSNKKGLVYEYMKNGSLDKILRKKDRRVEWNKLCDIMSETANGISYLHDKRIIHYDIKPANVLLDSEYFPKVADFGLAELMKRDVTHVTVSQLKGTPGYVAPEIAVMPFSKVTNKCDVYSFGMMLFDILGMSSINQNDEKGFLEIVWEGFQNEQLDKIIKDCGVQEKDKRRAKILSKVAFWCTQYTPNARPPMNDVVKMLRGELQVKTPPNPFMPSSDYIMQPLTEAYEEEVSYKEFKDKILTQPENEKLKAIEPQSAAPVINSRRESSNNLARYDFKSTAEKNDIVIRYVMQDHGFSGHIPVAALLTYKCLLHWCSEYLPHYPINDLVGRLIQTICSAIENQYEDRAPYWLSNTSMLLFLLDRSFKVKITNTSHSTSLFRRISRMCRPRLDDVNNAQSAPNIVHQVQEVKADHPAILFKQQLATYVEKIYEVVLDQLKEDLRSSLSLCIQAPTTASWRAVWKVSVTTSANNSPTGHWRSIISTLNAFLRKLQHNFVPRVLTSKIFSQAFYYINIQLFNSILKNTDCCSLGYGEYVKAGLYEFDHWCDLAKNYVGSSWDQLKHTRQAIKFLVIIDKSQISVDDLTKLLCPELSHSQLYRICRVYWDNENNTRGVSSDLVDKMRMLREVDRNNDVSSPFVLEDRSSIAFSVDDIFVDLEKADFSNITLNVEIVRHPGFEFFKL